MKLIDILALFKAIKNTAKKSHPELNMILCGVKSAYCLNEFKHLEPVVRTYYCNYQFVESYDDIDDDQIDTIVEQYYMGLGRKDIDDLDNLIALSAQYEGQSFTASSENLLMMYQELARMMNTFLVNVEKLNLLRGINSELDNIASTITQLYGLVTARLIQ